jgi:hypothetical protein
MAGIMVAAAAVAAGSALAKGISGAVQASKAKKALNNFKRQELKNVTEGMRVSTLGAELQTQEAQRRFSTSVDALRSGGVRGLVGGLGRQEQLQQVQQQRVSADLDRQQVAIEQMRAQDEGRIRGMQEQRETAAIAGLGREISEGRNQALAGAAGLAGSAFAGYELDKAGAFDGSGGGSLFKGASIGSRDSFKTGLSSADASAAVDAANKLARNTFGVQEGLLTAPNFNKTISPLKSGLTGSVDPVFIDQYSNKGITFTN